MLIKQLSIFVENRPGRLADITETLAREGINIRALSLADTSDFGILRLIVSDPEGAVTTLADAGITVRLTDVIGVCVSDTPGEFSRSVRILSDAGVSIEYLYAFVSRTNGEAVVILRVEEPERCSAILAEKGIRLLSDREAYSL